MENINIVLSMDILRHCGYIRCNGVSYCVETELVLALAKELKLVIRDVE